MSDILILTASFGMGHNSVSNALKEQIETRHKNARVVIADILEIVNPRVKGFSSKMYCELTENYPLVYNAFYDIKVSRRNNIIDSVFCNLYYKRFYEYMKAEKPKLIISTFPLCSCIVSRIKEEYGADVNLITVITDVVDSWEWIYKGTNLYLVPADEIKSRLVDKGIDKDSIIVTGIPVKKEFLSTNMRMPYRDKSTVLIVLSGIDNVPEDILYNLDNKADFKIKIVTGRNEKLYKKLSESAYSNIEIYGYVNNINQMMDESVFIVTKPGGVTIFEAINKELPIIALNSNIGQEKGNIEFIRKTRTGIVVDSLGNLPHILDYCANNSDIVNYYLKNIRRVKRTFNYNSFIGSVLNEVV